MSLIAVRSDDASVRDTLRAALPRWWDDLLLTGWDDLPAVVRERPVAACVIDVDDRSLSRAIAWLHGTTHRFPSVALGAVAAPGDLVTLHELGRAGLRHLLLREERGPHVWGRGVRRLLTDTVTATVVRGLSPRLPRALLHPLRAALECVHADLDADGFAGSLGWSRPHLSRRLRAGDLPSTGQLLTWARLIHAGAWLSDPGRSGQSVARQLGYANGSTFRRALKSYVGVRTSDLRTGGGVRVVLDAFKRSTRLDESPSTLRVA